ncbi:phosphoprotein phosphatase (plasmid) [Deinococcus aetherius]|uniref:Phosphoprotein phosphatase n=1 Tax=Deinococcus aetherius TaxID=200252 RepID=A0ABM8AM25_9DEIO|nr:metallophosphoesterase [Deinococcus aetherius]BDP44863.1 phosphoprotein phosphatase [Deinococcus aetherius]
MNWPVLIPDLHGRSDLLDVVLTAYPDRPLVFLGDLVDRGPDAPGVVARVRALVESGRATLCLGNHDHLFAHGMRTKALWNLQTVFQWPDLAAGRADAEWLLEHGVHWHRVGHVYLSHAAPHVPGSGGWGANTHPDHLWGRPDVERKLGRNPLPRGCTLAVHGHTPTRTMRGDRADLPLLLTWPDGTQAVYLDTYAWKSGVLATLDLADLGAQLHTVDGSRPAARLPVGEHTALARLT